MERRPRSTSQSRRNRSTAQQSNSSNARRENIQEARQARQFQWDITDEIVRTLITCKAEFDYDLHYDYEFRIDPNITAFLSIHTITRTNTLENMYNLENTLIKNITMTMRSNQRFLLGLDGVNIIFTRESPDIQTAEYNNITIDRYGTAEEIFNEQNDNLTTDRTETIFNILSREITIDDINACQWRGLGHADIAEPLEKQFHVDIYNKFIAGSLVHSNEYVFKGGRRGRGIRRGRKTKRRGRKTKRRRRR